jgi:outer membrane protein
MFNSYIAFLRSGWNSILHKFLFYWFTTLTLMTILGLSSVRAEEQPSEEEQNNNGGFMELSSTVAAFQSRFVDAPQHIGALLNIRLNYQWNGFFIEDKGLNSLGLPGLGYNFYNDPAWSFDVYFNEIYGEMASDDADALGNEQDGLKGIHRRGADERIGLRATYYFDETSVVRMLAAPFSARGGQGMHLAAWYGKTWQRQNINFHTIFSAQYDGSKTLNYYYGVADNEVSDKFPAYRAGSGITLSAELGLTYALTKDWVLESSVKLIHLPNSIYHSPLIEPRVEAIAQVSLVYVLF